MRITHFQPPKHDPRLTKEGALEHPTFLANVMAHWNRKLDTRAIAEALFEHESVIAFCVRIGREQRRDSAVNFCGND